jgi:hypothetical protein
MSYQEIAKLHAAARRERAEYIYCLFQRVSLWFRARLPRADAAVMNQPCCQAA